MDHHLVADLEVGDILADLVDNAAGVAAADVKILRLASLVAGRDDIDRHAQPGPDVVVVDARRHDVDQRLVVSRFGHVDHLHLPGLGRLAEAIGAHRPGVHLRRHIAQRRLLADRVEFLAFVQYVSVNSHSPDLLVKLLLSTGKT